MSDKEETKALADAVKGLQELLSAQRWDKHQDEKFRQLYEFFFPPSGIGGLVDRVNKLEEQSARAEQQRIQVRVAWITGLLGFLTAVSVAIITLAK